MGVVGGGNDVAICNLLKPILRYLLLIHNYYLHLFAAVIWLTFKSGAIYDMYCPTFLLLI